MLDGFHTAKKKASMNAEAVFYMCSLRGYLEAIHRNEHMLSYTIRDVQTMESLNECMQDFEYVITLLSMFNKYSVSTDWAP